MAKYKYWKAGRRTRRYAGYGIQAMGAMSGGVGAMGTAMRALSTANSIKNLLNVEAKYHDTVDTSQALDAAGQLILLNGLVPGDGATTRDGQSVKGTYLHIVGDLTLNTNLVQDMVRLVIVLDKQPNAAATTWATIYDGTASAAYNALRNINNGDRFKVLYDKTFALSQNGQAGKHFSIYIPLNKRLSKYYQKTKFNAGTAGTIADITSNALYFGFVGESQATNFSDIAYTARYRFIDN